MKRVYAWLPLIALTSSAQSTVPDVGLQTYFPLTAAPENHKVLLENEFVLVLDVSIPPSATVPPHLHPWPAVFITMKQARLAFRNLDGVLIRETRPTLTHGDPPLVEWREADKVPATVTNLSDHEQRAIRIELKFLGP